MAQRGLGGGNEEQTFVEDFLDSVQNLPTEVKRNLELMRSLDRSAREVLNEINEEERGFLQRAKQKIDAAQSRDVEPAKLIEEPETMALLQERRRKARQMVDEKVAVAEQTYAIVEPMLKRLRNDVALLEERLKASGAFDRFAPPPPADLEPPQAKPGDEVAFRPDLSNDEWFLARVEDFNSQNSEYMVVDEDDKTKKYTLPEAQVLILDPKLLRVAKGDEVLAMYPETTAFYRAHVAAALKRGETTIGVRFADDADETGQTPIRPVPTNRIVRVPEDG